MPTVHVPVSSWNFATNDVTVHDCGTGRAVCVHRAAVCLPDGVTACVRAESLDSRDGRHLVRLSNGLTAWVRPLRVRGEAGA